MHTGTVLSYDPARGYGYIHSDDGGANIMVHNSAVRRVGRTTLQPGQRLYYQPVNHSGRVYAEELRLMTPMRLPPKPAFA